MILTEDQLQELTGARRPSDEALTVAREWERCALVFAEASND